MCQLPFLKCHNIAKAIILYVYISYLTDNVLIAQFTCMYVREQKNHYTFQSQHNIMHMNSANTALFIH